jgi:hypothetical protein
MTINEGRGSLAWAHVGDLHITDDGTGNEYQLIRCVLERLQLPMYIIPGDRDRRPGDFPL